MIRPEDCMSRAIEIAAFGRRRVGTNPMVGAVLYGPDRNGVPAILAEGWHQQWGGPHAEIACLAEFDRRYPERQGQSLSDCTMYLNLEPCCHYGKTPPCTDELIKRQLGHCVVAMTDPNPKVDGKGMALLRQAGIIVSLGMLENQARELNRGFVSCITNQRPYTCLKMAISLDGKIAAADGSSRWISNHQARQEVQKLRQNYDAVLVGARTWLKDLPSLAIQNQANNQQPSRIIIDPQGRCVPNLRAKPEPERRTLLIVDQDCDLSHNPISGLEVYQMPMLNGQMDPSAILRLILNAGISSVLIEGGAVTATAFLKDSCIDKLQVYMAPIIIGTKGIPAFDLGMGMQLSEAWSSNDALVRNVADNACFELLAPAQGNASCLLA